jgi:hypothetical protein
MAVVHRVLKSFLALSLLFGACSGSSGTGSSRTGGVMGGATGGRSMAGEASASGGTTVSGGKTTSGGVSSGGLVRTGGSATGGTLTGGTVGNGESTATGGASATGGVSVTGGGARTGGAGASGSVADAGIPDAGRTGGTIQDGGADVNRTGGVTTGGVSSTGGAATTSGATSPKELVAFPGAQGFGRFAVGGRGKDVVHVTNLNDSGAGSLRDAISQANRTIVFDVGGVIKITSRLVFKNNLTIAGQTAPGGGITVYGDGTSFSNAHHTIVRYMRFRMGKVGESGKDTVTVAAGHDIIFDHCSLSWGRDGTFDLNQEEDGAIYNITLQDSIVSQGLQTHSTGGLVVTESTSILRSLFIDNNSRNPKARGTTQFVNNVIYNWVDSGYILGDTAGRSDGALVGNYFISGPETDGKTLDSPTPEYHVYADGNYYDSDKDGTMNGRLLAKGDFGTATWETTPSVSFPPVPALSAKEAYDLVIKQAGASRWRDPVDDYVVAELKSLGKQGKTISDETTLGIANVVGAVAGGSAPKDTDQDGMPDDWESSNGLDPANPADRNDDADKDGYTNLEEYLSSLVP